MNIGADRMDDKEYIVKAVELADGWKINKAGNIHAACVHRCSPAYAIQPVRDALAAQLMRQVDALPNIYISFRDEWVQVFSTENKGTELGCGFKLGRTMSAIKAIVDSKVLEQ